MLNENQLRCCTNGTVEKQARAEMQGGVGSKALKEKEKRQQYSLSSFYLYNISHKVSTKTHNIKQIYTQQKFKGGKPLTTVAPFAVQILCQLVADT